MAKVTRRISPHAATLRRNQTDCERIIWAALRNRQLGGFKFRRQVTIGPYIVDFLCIEARLIVELDGGQHSIEADAARSAFLEAQGHLVRRFWNNEVVENRDGVLEEILRVTSERIAGLPSPNPLPQAEEGSILPKPPRPRSAAPCPAPAGRSVP